MIDIWRAGEVMTALVVIVSAMSFPPFTSGAFWGIATLWGIVTILFDDETPRGVPGMEYWYTRQRRANGGEER